MKRNAYDTIQVKFKLESKGGKVINKTVSLREPLKKYINEILKVYKNELKYFQYKWPTINGKKLNQDNTFHQNGIKKSCEITLHFDIIITLKSLSEISKTQLITKSQIIKEKIENEISDDCNAINNIINKAESNEFISINYEIIPDLIINKMFDQGELGICYLVAGINACSEIPSIFDQLFIDKEYSANKKEYNFNIFINSKSKIITINDKFLYKMLENNKLIYEGNIPFEYELFLKLIVKLFAEICKDNANLDSNELYYEINKLENIEGGDSSYLYSCLFGTSTFSYKSTIENIEKYINRPGVILATSTLGPKGGHQYAIKNLLEYKGKTEEKEKFITLFNPWGKGNIDYEDFDFKKVQNVAKNYEYVYNFNEKYNFSGLVKIPLNLFGTWFTELEVCEPKYGFYYKVFNNFLKKNNNHYYCFYNNIKQKIEIEVFLSHLNNVRAIRNDDDIELSLSKIEKDYSIINVIKTTQKESIFYIRKNAYIYCPIEEGNYLIIIKYLYFYGKENEYEYNIRIGSEFDYLNNINENAFLKLKTIINNQIININDNIVISKYILLEKTFYDMKVYSIAKKIYNIFYDPYENNTDIEVQNGLKKIISIIKNAYDKEIYKIIKNYENDKNEIYYLFKNVKEKLREDAYNLLIIHEEEILKLIKQLGEYSKNVKIILRRIDDSIKEETLDKLKEIISGSEIQKQRFYGSIRGYTISQFGIEIYDANKKFENTEFFKKIVFKELPTLFRDENLFNNCEFFAPIINDEINTEDLIDKNLCDILFMIDATSSMGPYVKATIDNCIDIVENINFNYYKEKKFKYGAIFYRDPIDCKGQDIHSFFPMSFNKDDFQNKIKSVIAQGGGDYAEDWNGAYEIALNQMNWTNEKSNKIIIHIADSSAHGKEFIEPGIKDSHDEEGPKFIKTIEEVAKKGFKIIAFPIGEVPPIKSFKKFMEIYRRNKGYSFTIFKSLMNINEFSRITEEVIRFIINHQ